MNSPFKNLNRWWMSLGAWTITVSACCLSSSLCVGQGNYSSRSHFATVGGTFSGSQYSGTIVVPSGVSIDEVSGGNVQSVSGAGPELVTQLGLTSTFSGPAPGIFSFGRSEFLVAENGLRVIPITVVRNGGAGGDVTVIVTPSALPNEAVVGADFATTPVAVTFRDGNLVKEAVITLLNDVRTELNERVNLTLSLAPNSPALAGLGQQTSAVLTIRDDDDDLPPVISDILDQRIDEDGRTSALEFVVSDDQTLPDGLTVSVESSNHLLVPLGGVLVTGSGRNRFLTVVPNPNAFGQAVISVLLSDDLWQIRESFVLTVAPINDVPTMDPMPDVRVVEDSGTHVYPISIADIETPAGDLTVTASSSNPDLIVEGGLEVFGDGATRSLSVSLRPNVIGSTVITVLVSDGADSISESFQLSVVGENDLPVIVTPLDVSIAEDESFSKRVVVTDVDSAIADLQIESLTATSDNLFPEGSLTWVRAADGFDIMGAPARDQSGEAVVTLRVGDQINSVETHFNVTVRPVNDAPFFNDVHGVTIEEDSSTTVALNIGDIDSAIETLKVSVTSMNAELLPQSGLRLEGAGEERRLEIVPSRDQFGAATIVLLVDDGELSTELRLAVAVHSVDDPPFLGEIAPIEMIEDSEHVVEFEFGDPDTERDLLVLSVSSDGGDLFSADGLLVESELPTGRLTLRPSRDQVGEETIRLRLSDGQSTVDRVFSVLVSNVNDAPTVSMIEDVVIEGGQNAIVRFEVFDPDHEPSRLSVDAASTNRALFSDSSLEVDGLGAERSLQLQPLLDEGGQATLLIGVSDGIETITTSFNVDVLPVDRPDPAAPVAAQMQIERQGDTLLIRWDTDGRLQASSQLFGPFTDVLGAKSPYQTLMSDDDQKFYRVVSLSDDQNPDPATARIERSPSGTVIRWGGSGILEGASTIDGPYVRLENTASPYQVPQAAGDIQFYRVVQP